MNLLLWLLIYALLIGLLHWRNPEALSNPAFRFVKILFPTWKFFEDLGVAPQLLYRVEQKGYDFGPWMLAIPKKSRKPWHLFINPEINYLLAVQSQLQQLAADSQDFLEPAQGEQLQLCPSYLIIRHFIQGLIRTNGGAARFQFKVCAVDPLSAQSEIGEVILSPVEDFL